MSNQMNNRRPRKPASKRPVNKNGRNVRPAPVKSPKPQNRRQSKPRPQNSHNRSGYNQKPKSDQRKKAQEKAKKQEQNSLFKKVELSTIDLLPFIKGVNNYYSGFLLNDGTYMNIFQILGQDYSGMSNDNIVIQASIMDKFYLTLEENTAKIVNLSLALDTRTNQAFRQRKRKQCKNPEYKQINREAIEELKALDNRQCKKSYLEIYAETPEKLDRFNRRVISILCNNGLARQISPEEKIQYLQKKNNPYNYGYI